MYTFSFIVGNTIPKSVKCIHLATKINPRSPTIQGMPRPRPGKLDGHCRTAQGSLLYFQDRVAGVGVQSFLGLWLRVLVQGSRLGELEWAHKGFGQSSGNFASRGPAGPRGFSRPFTEFYKESIGVLGDDLKYQAL